MGNLIQTKRKKPPKPIPWLAYSCLVIHFCQINDSAVPAPEWIGRVEAESALDRNIIVPTTSTQPWTPLQLPITETLHGTSFIEESAIARENPPHSRSNNQTIHKGSFYLPISHQFVDNNVDPSASPKATQIEQGKQLVTPVIVPLSMPASPVPSITPSISVVSLELDIETIGMSIGTKEKTCPSNSEPPLNLNSSQDDIQSSPMHPVTSLAENPLAPILESSTFYLQSPKPVENMLDDAGTADFSNHAPPHPTVSSKIVKNSEGEIFFGVSAVQFETLAPSGTPNAQPSTQHSSILQNPAPIHQLNALPEMNSPIYHQSHQAAQAQPQIVPASQPPVNLLSFPQTSPIQYQSALPSPTTPQQNHQIAPHFAQPNVATYATNSSSQPKNFSPSSSVSAKNSDSFRYYRMDAIPSLSGNSQQVDASGFR